MAHYCFLYILTTSLTVRTEIFYHLQTTLSDDDPIQLFSREKACINDLFEWICANKLSLNTRKTNYMLIQPPNKKYDFSNLNLSVNGNTLSNEDSCKFLGIYIDESLSWKKHLKYINSNISRSLFVMKQSKGFLPSCFVFASVEDIDTDRMTPYRKHISMS